GKTWLVEGSIRQPILRAEACPAAIALVRPRAVRNNPLLHSPLEELHIDSLSSQPPPSFDRATSTRRTRITLDYNVLVGSKREAWRFRSLIDLPESFIGSSVDPFTLIIKIRALARTLQILENKSRLAVHRPL